MLNVGSRYANCPVTESFSEEEVVKYIYVHTVLYERERERERERESWRGGGEVL